MVRDEPSSHFAMSVFGWFSRKGRWVAPRAFTSLSVFGGGEIDLRDARFAGREIRVRVFALWGYTEVIVPDDVEVEIKGFGLFGVFDRSAVHRKRGAPRIVISGLALFGGVGTRVKAAPAKRPDRTPVFRCHYLAAGHAHDVASIPIWLRDPATTDPRGKATPARFGSSSPLERPCRWLPSQ